MNNRKSKVFESIARRWRNFWLCKKYPFLKQRNVWDDKFMGYDSTWYDCIASGWRTAFGEQLLDELNAQLKKEGSMRDFRFTDIKEKYGTLRLYASGVSYEVESILSKYEYMSMCYCINCGKPVRYATSGWVMYICEDCFNEKERQFDEYRSKHDGCQSLDEYRKKRRLTKGSIPQVRYFADDGTLVEVDLNDKYGIDFAKAWGLDE